MPRQTFKGTLNVHRVSSQHEHLAATIFLPDGSKFYYYPCPKAFDSLVSDGLRNVVEVEFKADLDGKNPRSAKTLSSPVSPF